MLVLTTLLSIRYNILCQGLFKTLSFMIEVYEEELLENVIRGWPDRGRKSYRDY